MPSQQQQQQQRRRKRTLFATATTTASSSSSSTTRVFRSQLSESLQPLPPTTLSRFMLEYTRVHPEMRDLESLMASVQMACKTISMLVQRAGLSEMTGCAADGAINVQGEEQKKLDVISNQVFKDALRFTGRLGVVASEEETNPVLVEEAYDAKYVAVFDPLDGSSNVDAAIATGTIFGIFEQTEECGVVAGHVLDDDRLSDDGARCLLNALQRGSNLVAAGYCMYSSSTILVLSFGHGVHGFTLDPRISDFVLSHPNMTVPKRGKIYSVNDANSDTWEPPLVRDYFQSLKSGKNRANHKYSSRYVGSMVADVHRTLLYGGVYAYPADSKHPDGKIRLLYEAAPMSFLVNQAGGRASTGINGTDILDVQPTSVHQRTPCFIGSKDDIDDLDAFLAAETKAEEPSGDHHLHHRRH
eukprot:CAMPEP_0118912492 /NCGR_PEP_ID=MMETSP1166-20130328/13710_1 /TAXON_ID=1104430 /ORGANISM="Chrysoreinhardia sp, Strain CCMP3193" /LENGTH=413 /DNA_ID=CAMNT_0006852011 /DNA_START=76 /DNA_END=1317 /DNA_ORIENTATION=+